MRGGFTFALFFLIAFITVVDWYTFRGVRLLSGNLVSWLKTFIYILYWIVPLSILLLMGVVAIHYRNTGILIKYKGLYSLIGLFILFYIPKLVFILFQLSNDLVRLFGITLTRFSTPGSDIAVAGASMSRAEFLTKIGIVVAAIPFLTLLRGIAKGRYDYQVKKIKLKFENLPDSFAGFRVLQISDWHIGSFSGKLDRVEEAVELINSQNADVILFTGDLVNNTASEVTEFLPALKKLRAEYGIFSILGNHDYGDYVHWESKDAYQQNLYNLFSLEEKAGFRLLRNESVFLQKGGERIGLAGVENWGAPPFPQYGDLQKALKEIEKAPFKILMSHDPSHWDAEVLKTDIDLTLSGHTHGLQFGINRLGIKWSPVKWKYPRWQGLYWEGRQKLYVNVGIGYIAFPGRVGFLPEITVIELQNSEG
jgi:uncharacterized protein